MKPMPEIDRLRLPFREQIDFFRGKLNLPSERWDSIQGAAHDRGFIVAGAQVADLVADLRGAVDAGIAGGDTLADFRRNFDAIVGRHGWTGWTGEGSKAGVAWRTKVIYGTNVRTSYAAGRWAQLNDPELLAVRPFWRYIHRDSVLHPRPQHVAWNGLVLRHDHPFWRQGRFPPNGWGCGCMVQAVRGPADGDATEPPAGWDVRDAKGNLSGVDRGWDYAPGANAATPLRELIDKKLIALDAPIGAALAQAMRPVLREEQARAFASFVDSTLADKVRGKHVVAGALKPAWIDAAARRDIVPKTAEIAVRDQDVWHTFRDAKAHKLDLDWYKNLPHHLDAPGAVVLDTTHPDAPAFLLLYDAAGDAAKLVVRVNYQVKKAGAMNIVETGQKIDPSGVRAMLGHGYELIDGRL